MPSRLKAAFAAGTLASADLVLGVMTGAQYPSVAIHARAEDAEIAKAYLDDLRRRAREAEGFLRGRCLRVRGDGDRNISVMPVKVPAARREDVIVSDAVWREIDLNVSALFGRRELLVQDGARHESRDAAVRSTRYREDSAVPRTGRGVGRRRDCRVLRCARDRRSRMGTVYRELGRLAPALMVLEDLDLVVGNRRSGRDGGLHEFLTALDGAMTNHDGVVTVATTNDIKALDDAAIRAARFDRIIEIPLPDAGLRASILRRYLGELADGIDVVAVAGLTDGASGAALRELVRRAVLVDGDAFTTATLIRLAREGLGAERTGQYL